MSSENTTTETTVVDETLSSQIDGLASGSSHIFDAFYAFLEPLFDIADGAATLLGMFA
ncbi:MAG: hypothetical protein SPJ78_11185 [Corynebacterium camporealensis]|uniref:hypothetical protein n=1 Tax=Corynebacterium camporealensis TaxID=161896 RepID=UPI002A90B0F8|nr:hypothetical protein [Corynebacterium camporealensis]MDY5841257.1 hypothetical protein [Corynebacterium camporealensis]